jgi:hypothetical protein
LFLPFFLCSFLSFLISFHLSVSLSLIPSTYLPTYLPTLGAQCYCRTWSHSTTFSSAVPNVVNMFTFGRQSLCPAQRHYFFYQWAHCHNSQAHSFKIHRLDNLKLFSITYWAQVFCRLVFTEKTLLRFHACPCGTGGTVSDTVTYLAQ